MRIIFCALGFEEKKNIFFYLDSFGVSIGEFQLETEVSELICLFAKHASSVVC